MVLIIKVPLKCIKWLIINNPYGLQQLLCLPSQCHMFEAHSVYS